MPDYPVTPAVRALRSAGIAFEPHVFTYEEKGGTHHSSQALGVPEHQVIKTLILEDDRRQPLCVLMHGDRQVSTRQLARDIGARSVAPCAPEVAQRHSGYLVGGTSPFGLKRAMPIYVERTILALPRLYINGGKRGFLVSMAPGDLGRALELVEVSVAIEG